MARSPEDNARENIDLMLEKAGWHIYGLKEANIYAHREIKTPNLKRVKLLWQAILRRAFSGKLVACESMYLLNGDYLRKHAYNG